MCMAIKSVKSQHERGHDLLLTFSIKFYQGSGWAAFGVGDQMDRALMFVLWPGEHEGGECPVLQKPLRNTNLHDRHHIIVALNNRTPRSNAT